MKRAGRRIKDGHREEGAVSQPAFTQASEESVVMGRER